MLRLNDVTLICYEVMAHDLMIAAMEHTLARIDFAETLVWSDRDLKIKNSKWIEVGSLGKYETLTEMLWYTTAEKIQTSHFLFMSYKGGIVNENKWSNEFLDYDYIGAVWPWHNTHRVGNGTGLRSVKLSQTLKDNKKKFPIVGKGEDSVLSREYRDELEILGIKWAPENLALKFAFERGPQTDSFMFHGMYNMPKVLSKEDMKNRFFMTNNYVRNHPEYNEMLRNITLLGVLQ